MAEIDKLVLERVKSRFEVYQLVVRRYRTLTNSNAKLREAPTKNLRIKRLSRVGRGTEKKICHLPSGDAREVILCTKLEFWGMTMAI